ncbi:unnamed protein product [Staurois parvus]|uniref:Uncharacterized protein n=1 Tax=Staurois parvus TaxID=386267 RepID=A0ABN9EQU4_9NEOB|nr:unnamed protein product [Staurois parvus]
MFDPVFPDPPLHPQPPIHLLIEQSLRSKLHMLSLVFFFLSWESACDQHRANQHCPDRGFRGPAAS